MRKDFNSKNACSCGIEWSLFLGSRGGCKESMDDDVERTIAFNA